MSPSWIMWASVDWIYEEQFLVETDSNTVVWAINNYIRQPFLPTDKLRYNKTVAYSNKNKNWINKVCVLEHVVNMANPDEVPSGSDAQSVRWYFHARPNSLLTVEDVSYLKVLGLNGSKERLPPVGCCFVICSRPFVILLPCTKIVHIFYRDCCREHLCLTCCCLF